MGLEIERKFKVLPSWRPKDAGSTIAQGYLTRDPKRTVRVRLLDAHGFLTIKGETHGCTRAEYEYEIPAEDARALLALSDRPPVEKTRYPEDIFGMCWEIDVFHGANEGLIVAEVELPDAAAHLVLPDWAGDEVTGDARYYNAALAAHPYRDWPKAE